jgi:hypothetical protein
VIDHGSYDTARWAERRRPFDLLEQRIVTLHLARPDADSERLVDALRYVASFARLTSIQTAAGADVDVRGPLALHAQQIRDDLSARLADATSLWDAVRALPDLTAKTRRARKSLLDHLPIDRESLEDEVTTRKLAVISGGGGGAGYVYPGCYEELERGGLVPDLMIGTSIGALMSMFRARRLRYDPAPMVQAGRSLAWSNVFRVLESESRYGLPATLRLYLRAALSNLFKRPDGDPVRLADMEIPLYIITTGLTVHALKHDLDFYEHLLDEDVTRNQLRSRVTGVVKAIGVIREFLSRPDALREVVLGRAPGTEEFDVLDAAGFSASIPGVIHYDVLREDQRMKRLLDDLYATYGITRLSEGGMVANVPARVAWETITSGKLGRRNSFVLALDCFAPNPRQLVWYPLQQAVRSSNVEKDKAFADLYLPITRTLSPMNLVPPVRDFLTAMRWGREALAPHMPFVRAMMRPIAVLPSRGDTQAD